MADFVKENAHILMLVADNNTKVVSVMDRMFHVIEVQPLDLCRGQRDVIPSATPPGRCVELLGVVASDQHRPAVNAEGTMWHARHREVADCWRHSKHCLLC